MTTKEAIERINHLIELLKSPRTIIPYCKEELQALDLAIKALEEDRYYEGYSDGYLDGYSGADWKAYTPDSFTSAVQRWRKKNDQQRSD